MRSTIGNFFCRAIHPLCLGLTVIDEYTGVSQSLSVRLLRLTACAASRGIPFQVIPAGGPVRDEFPVSP